MPKLCTVQKCPNGQIYRSGLIDSDIAIPWVKRMIDDVGYLGYEHWLEDEDGDEIDMEQLP